jgi:ATPase subunit of ABC transporter with duplicated ATPase domains
MKVRFSEREFHGDEVLVTEGLTKSFGEKKLFEGLDLEITAGERIALIGDNGTGKSTFIKLIMGEETPDSGYLYRGPSVKTAYLPQIVHFDDPNLSILDTVISESRCSAQEARNRLGAFMFSGEDVFKPVCTLSGGEQSRLRLCILMREEINFLILDEPTNHLDISSREWIESCLYDYGEALLFVSHDRYFIDHFATRIWYLENGQITDFRGDYNQFRQSREREENLERSKKAVEKKTQKKPKPKAPPNTEKQLAKLEREIAKLEEAIAECDRQCEEFSSDYEKLIELGETRETLDAQLNELYEKWETLA